MDEPPAQALRYKKDSSMRVAVTSVKSGEAHACVSAGNTGALMAISRFVLKTLPASTGRDRHRAAEHAAHQHLRAGPRRQRRLHPGAPAAVRHHGRDAGRRGRAQERPSVGLLNIGVEDIKGNEAVKQAADLLRASGLNFAGNVEGDDIYKGTVDVVVCDGFVGNVALKPPRAWRR